MLVLTWPKWQSLRVIITSITQFLVVAAVLLEDELQVSVLPCQLARLQRPVEYRPRSRRIRWRAWKTQQSRNISYGSIIQLEKMMTEKNNDNFTNLLPFTATAATITTTTTTTTKTTIISIIIIKKK